MSASSVWFLKLLIGTAMASTFLGTLKTLHTSFFITCLILRAIYFCYETHAYLCLWSTSRQEHEPWHPAFLSHSSSGPHAPTDKPARCRPRPRAYSPHTVAIGIGILGSLFFPARRLSLDLTNQLNVPPTRTFPCAGCWISYSNCPSEPPDPRFVAWPLLKERCCCSVYGSEQTQCPLKAR